MSWKADKWPTLLHDKRMQTVLGEGIEMVAEEAAGALLDQAEDSDQLIGSVLAGTEALSRGLYTEIYGEAEQETKTAWQEAIGSLMQQTPELEELRRSVAGDPDMTALASGLLMKEIAPSVGKAIAKVPPKTDPMGQPSKEDLDKILAANQAAGAAAMAKGALKAQKAVAEARENLNGLLPGLGTAPDPQDQSSPERLALIERMQKDARLKKILRIAGRIQRISARVREQRVAGLKQEIVDIERGGDIDLLLPHEIANIAPGGHPALALLALARISERSALQYKVEGTEPLQQGPIAVLLDASGSMAAALADGLRRIDWAAAIGISAVRTGKLEKRQVSIAVFDTAIIHSWKIKPGDSRAAKDSVLGLASLGLCGGTDFSVGLDWALDNGAEQDRADIILVTDGFGGVLPKTMDRVKAAKARGLRVWGIVAGEGGIPAALVPFCDGVLTVDGSGDAAEKIGALGAT